VGVIQAARISSGQPTAGSGYELDAIAAVAIGGTSMSGGHRNALRNTSSDLSSSAFCRTP
jgi:ribose/xylose/arabinose/galactoside ABC-type transport system permease subunit